VKGRELCRKNEDYVSMQLFESCERRGNDFLETQLDLLDDRAQNYGQLQADAADESGEHH
jgi:bacterioferritin (cytochrome b1)